MREEQIELDSQMDNDRSKEPRSRFVDLLTPLSANNFFQIYTLSMMGYNIPFKNWVSSSDTAKPML